jgi:hypothetical protein
MMRKPLIGPQILFAAAAFESSGICANAIEQGCGKQGPRSQAQGLEQTGHHAAGCADIQANVNKGVRFKPACQVRTRMMVDNQVIDQVAKGGIMGRLGIDHRKVIVNPGFFRLPRLCRNTQVANHGQVVRPCDFIDAHYVNRARPAVHQTLESQCGCQGVRVGIDHDRPAAVANNILPPLPESKDFFGILRHASSRSARLH